MLNTDIKTTYRKILYFKGSTIRSCSALFCITISIASLVRSSMDCFIKINSEKKDEQKSTIHEKEYNLLKECLENNENIFLCGRPGVCKTYLLNMLVNKTNSIELETDHLKNDSNFLTFVKNSNKHIFIEDYLPDVTVYKRMIESVSDGNKVTNGSFIVVSDQMLFYPNFKTIIIETKKPEILATLVHDNQHEMSKILQMAIKSRGNIRNFFSYLGGSDNKDFIQTSKEFIYETLSSNEKIKIIEYISEHGNVWHVFQENYPSSQGIDMSRCAESFSLCDIYDTEMYSGNWCLMPYFIFHAVVLPKRAMKKAVEIDKIRPGKCWTKHGNYKMRRQKLKEITKESNTSIGIDELCLLKKYAEVGNMGILMDYNITPQKFDIMNHISLSSKLKQRDVTKIKKAIKHEIEQRERKD